MESIHDSFYTRHPVLRQVQEERDILEADNGGACKGSGVPGRGLDPSEVHDLRNPNQASGRVPLHPHPPVEEIPFTLLHFLKSLEPTEYRGEIKHVVAKIDRGEYKERDGSLAVGKRLCTKVNSLLQDFLVIRGKLEVQRAFASPGSMSREKRPPDPSQGPVDTVRASPASGRAKPRQQSGSVGRQPTQNSPSRRHQVDNPLLQPPRYLRLLRLALRTR